MGQIYSKRVFSVGNWKSERHHWILHSWISLQLFKNYLKQTLVFILNSALWEKFNFCFESAKLRALRAYMLTCQRALRAYVLTCQHMLSACLRANVFCMFTYSHANVPCVITCSRANVPYVLTCSFTNVPCVLTCSRANVIVLMPLFSAALPLLLKLHTLLKWFKSLITVFPQ